MDMRIGRMTWGFILFFTLHCAFASDEKNANMLPDIERGILSCKQGNFNLAVVTLEAAYADAQPGSQRIKAAGALGAAYMQMRRSAQAEILLREAYAAADVPLDRARYGIDLANVLAGRGQIDSARKIYDEVLALAPADVPIVLSVELNRLQIGDKNDKRNQLGQLNKLFAMLPELKHARDRSRFAINLGIQAKKSGDGGMALAYQSFDMARSLAEQAKETRLQVEALDQLAQLYEDQHRFPDALRLIEAGMMVSQAIESHDLQINLEWRRGRILRQQDNIAAAIAAYQRAVSHIEAIRLDIPVEYQDGRSSFRDMLEPVYLGLADLLLQQSSTLDGQEKNAQLRRARNAVELIKQTELEDFLGDRCAIGTIRHSVKDVPIAAHTAVLYPIILADRVELLLETSLGLQRRAVPINAPELAKNVSSLASALRANRSYQVLARKLNDILLQPIDAILKNEAIDTLVVVPDGVLRLLPFGVLHDGERFAIQKYAIALVPGLTMTDTGISTRTGLQFKTLLAGISEPGSVVEKLPESMVEQLLFSYEPTSSVSDSAGLKRTLVRSLPLRTRSLPPDVQLMPTGAQEPLTSLTMAEKADRHRKLKKILALAGVQDEIDTLSKLSPGHTLLNEDFSLRAFSDQIKSGDYKVVHIASHGVFGGTADSTFIMAHDELITIDKLQGFLRSAGMRDHPIELLTLSACETAEGDDRAPLGLSGAALKARAKSALGSLWPVADDAAKMLMGEFYKDLFQPGVSKAKALQKAQLRLIEDRNFKHPFFWAPFVLVGGWL